MRYYQKMLRALKYQGLDMLRHDAIRHDMMLCGICNATNTRYDMKDMY